MTGTAAADNNRAVLAVKRGNISQRQGRNALTNPANRSKSIKTPADSTSNSIGAYIAVRPTGGGTAVGQDVVLERRNSANYGIGRRWIIDRRVVGAGQTVGIEV